MVLHQSQRRGLFRFPWVALHSKQKDLLHLLVKIAPRELHDSRRERIRLLKGERTIEEIQRLKRCGGDIPPGCYLAAIGTVEHAEGVVQLHAGLVLVDHPAELGRPELLFGRVDLHVVRVGLEQIEARATHLEIECARHEEHRIPQRFRFNPTGPVAPEQT